ncbi:phosphopantetheine-binding protein [Streptomyces sp. SAS_270]|uniref:phosphopantetheine-binding protein n=1 Tax=Streptomyces sp. SAS_270 TaxID=3412748 RepID=UPI00403D3664
MTSEPWTVPRPASAAPGAGVLGEVRAALAGVLHIDPSHLDAAQPFQALGLDSLLSVEFVALLNARLGTRLAPGVLYDHPTPAALAAHVAAAENTPAPAPAGVPAPDSGPGSGSVAGEVSAQAAVAEVLRGQLAQILHCDAWEIDPGAAFAHLGIDSLLAAEFVAGINRAYHLTERPDVLYDYPDIASMSAHLAARITHTPPNPNPSPGTSLSPGTSSSLSPGFGTGTGSGSVTGAGLGVGGGVVSGVVAGPVAGEGAVPGGPVRAPLAEQELNVLLDAVRANVLSVDQAVALLAARTA